MKSQVGLWIDHREAIIVTLIDQVEEMIRITSDVEEFVSDADAPHVSQQDRHDKRFDAHLRKYFGEVINAIRHADSIVIFGPGVAKFEFQKELESQGLAEQIVAVETTDNMTEAQIVAKVRQHFVDLKNISEK
jgi:stalled ribosome rescue protein Dom34